MAYKSLFSPHYLDTRLPLTAEWSEDAGDAFYQLQKLWHKAKRFGEKWSEAQTEEEFVKPLLSVLGWSYVVQPKNSTRGRVTRPDYALFESKTAKDEAQHYLGQDEPFYGRALAIAEAKHWGRPLSHYDTSDRATWKSDSNPSFQMVNYLTGTRVAWGILTNGIEWRLYAREASSVASEYYAIDLGIVFDFLGPDGKPSDAQLADFKRWWLLFRRAAFIPGTTTKAFIHQVQEGSATYATEISGKLKELVFKRIMPQIAGGFVSFRRRERRITVETPELLDEIYRASLGLLYKLLFILYAEARNLLPMDHPGYREKSLYQMARWAAERIDRQLPLSEATHATDKYNELLGLFRRIDRGDPSFGVPQYDGGLFNPATPENRFLEAHALSDHILAHAIDLLVRDAGEPVDYAYISVRNLGSIYEGLLENKLFLPEGPGNSAAPSQTTIELVKDKGERKATGSYYTPDYIVDYIVRNTLGPVLEARDVEFRAGMAKIADLQKQLRKTTNPGAIQVLREKLANAESEAREAFLGIKVLDPAMGSGHFLVNAVDFLTDQIIARLQAYHDEHADFEWTWNPIQNLIEWVRAGVVREMAGQGIPLDEERLPDTALLTRIVMKRCIYGVDLNRMAVELAKVSLWLHSFAIGAPLGFLDHHLRWGNSLIGTDVRTVQEAIKATSAGQMTLFAGPFAGLLDLTAVMLEVAGRADATLADVRQSAEDFSKFEAALTPFKQILDLWVSQYFDNQPAREFLELFGADLLPALRGERALDPKYHQAIEREKELWEEKRFFHWDLEFPEVFVDLSLRDWAKNGGFNTIIGNPPYVNIENVDKDAIPFWLIRFVSSKRRFDLYILFYEQAIELLKESGQFGLITPEGFLSLPNGELLRTRILESTAIRMILDLTKVNVFDKVSNTVVVVVAEKNAVPESHQFHVFSVGRGSDPVADIQNPSVSSYESAYRHPHRVIKLGLPQKLFDIIQKCYQQTFQLKEMCYVSYGAQPVPLEKFLSNVQVDDRYKKMVKGESVSRYSVNWKGLFLKYEPSELHRPAFPELFERENILVGRVTGEKGLEAVVPPETYYTDKTVNICIPYYNLLEIDEKIRKQRGIDLSQADDFTNFSIHYIVSIINSSLLSTILRKWISGQIDVFPENLRDLPIRRIIFTTDIIGRENLARDAERLYRFGIEAPSKDVISFIDLIDFVDNTYHSKNANTLSLFHDLLAYLAGRMIEFNKVKLEEINGFLRWVEREIGVPLDDLIGKSFIQNYLGEYQNDEPALEFDSLIDRLRRNRGKLKIDPSDRKFQERLRIEYEASLEKLLPLKARLAATDRLIDQIVYKLYGLTEDEITIVEGTAR